MLFKLSHENTGFKTLHFRGKAKQFKVRLPLALSKLSSKVFFKTSNGSAEYQNVPKDLLGQAGKGVGIFEFL
jgi:hypothetical protein